MQSESGLSRPRTTVSRLKTVVPLVADRQTLGWTCERDSLMLDTYLHLDSLLFFLAPAALQIASTASERCDERQQGGLLWLTSVSGWTSLCKSNWRVVVRRNITGSRAIQVDSTCLGATYGKSRYGNNTGLHGRWQDRPHINLHFAGDNRGRGTVIQIPIWIQAR